MKSFGDGGGAKVLPVAKCFQNCIALSNAKDYCYTKDNIQVLL